MGCKDCKNFEGKPKTPNSDEQIATLKSQLQQAKILYVESASRCGDCFYKRQNEQLMFSARAVNNDSGDSGDFWVTVFVIAGFYSIVFNIIQFITWLATVI